MSTEQELKELMGLVAAVAQDTALYMGNIVQISKVETSAQALEDRLRALLAELDAEREDAARYRWLRDSSNKVLWDGLMQTFSFAHQEFDRKIDAARKGDA